jgi:hypothetical protein
MTFHEAERGLLGYPEAIPARKMAREIAVIEELLWGADAPVKAAR